MKFKDLMRFCRLMKEADRFILMTKKDDIIQVESMNVTFKHYEEIVFTANYAVKSEHDKICVIEQARKLIEVKK